MVFSTLHTTPRLIHHPPARHGHGPVQLCSDALLGGLAQRLAKALRLQSYNPARRNLKEFTGEYAHELQATSPVLTQASPSSRWMNGWSAGAEGGQLRFYKAVAAKSAIRPVTKAALAARS
jgi:hypothetical protein